MTILRLVIALLSGVLFGLGLSVAQMVDPMKVLNFLDFTGRWDPSLAFVMGGGLVVNGLATVLIMKRSSPILAEQFKLPTKYDIDRRIIIGGLIFGVGWGIAGYCPGPIITSIGFINQDITIVLLSYLIGTWLARHLIIRYDHRSLPTKASIGSPSS